MNLLSHLEIKIKSPKTCIYEMESRSCCLITKPKQKIDKSADLSWLTKEVRFLNETRSSSNGESKVTKVPLTIVSSRLDAVTQWAKSRHRTRYVWKTGLSKTNESGWTLQLVMTHQTKLNLWDMVVKTQCSQIISAWWARINLCKTHIYTILEPMRYPDKVLMCSMCSEPMIKVISESHSNRCHDRHARF